MNFFIIVYHLAIAAWQNTPKHSGLKQQMFIIIVSMGQLNVPSDLG